MDTSSLWGTEKRSLRKILPPYHGFLSKVYGRPKEKNRCAVAIKNPWFAGAIVLYLFQVAVFTWAFVSGWQLSIVGILQTALYAIIVLVSGVVLFGEGLSFHQWIGVTFALVGVILLNV